MTATRFPRNPIACFNVAAEKICGGAFRHAQDRLRRYYSAPAFPP